MAYRVIVLALCLWTLWGTQAKAQLFLENGKEALNVTGGQRLNGSLLIHNTSAAPADIRAYWEDFEYKPPYDGGKNFLPAGTAPNSASKWVAFSPQNFSLPPYGQQTVDYTVTVPETIKEGHYGVLFFERSSDKATTMNGVSIVERVGCLFFIEPKDKDKKADLENIRVQGHKLIGDFIDQGNVVLEPSTTYYVMRNDGMVILRGQAPKLYLPPGASAPLKIEFKNPLEAGHYSMVINCDLGEGDVVVKDIGLAVDAGGRLTIENSPST